MIASEIDVIYFPVVVDPFCAAGMADGRAISGRHVIWPLKLPEKFHIIRITGMVLLQLAADTSSNEFE